VRFETARAQDYEGSGFDLVTMFDALHDMGDPVGAATHVRETLAPGGTLMLVEPRAGDSLAENLNPVGRVYYAFSTSVCVPASLGQEVGAALGAQAGEKRIGRSGQAASPISARPQACQHGARGPALSQPPAAASEFPADRPVGEMARAASHVEEYYGQARRTRRRRCRRRSQVWK
jgi:hypothetical protein